MDEDYTPWGGGSRGNAYYRKQPRVQFGPDARDGQYRAILAVHECPHGRRRKVGMDDLKPWAGLECKTGQCPMVYLSAAAVFSQWRDEDRQPG